MIFFRRQAKQHGVWRIGENGGGMAKRINSGTVCAVKSNGDVAAKGGSGNVKNQWRWQKASIAEKKMAAAAAAYKAYRSKAKMKISAKKASINTGYDVMAAACNQRIDIFAMKYAVTHYDHINSGSIATMAYRRMCMALRVSEK